jgi:hypothetical protein
VEAAMAAAEEVGAGCVLCGTIDFLRGAFGERTMLLCDQCEREFHVGCLRSSGRCVLESIPEGAGSLHLSLPCYAAALSRKSWVIEVVTDSVGWTLW